jgi:hypothetical protein
MEPRTIARLIALGRVAIGATLIAAPEAVGERWIGRAGRSRGAQVVLMAVGARDLALGLGAAWALGGGEPARAWLLAGVAVDATDLVATFRHRDAVPVPARAGVAVLAGGAAALGLWLQSELD